MTTKATYFKKARPEQITVWRADVERWQERPDHGIAIKRLGPCTHEHRTPEAAERCAASIAAHDRGQE